MNKVLYIILISLFSLTIFSCAKEEEKTEAPVIAEVYPVRTPTDDPSPDYTFSSTKDGTTWTAQTSGTSNNISGVTYGNGTFMIVGDSGTIITSSDGTTWTSRTSGITNILWGVTSL